ncbi:hypothetical protein [Arsukibacterium sp. UBA3155]|nr:hypothetical protein [Arsukibacterium sp. UBA3155]|tara:strand:+ start:52709 stop:52834 length:126 start_codon:yes stop_codon:yes gene_type:complete
MKPLFDYINQRTAATSSNRFIWALAIVTTLLFVAAFTWCRP